MADPTTLGELEARLTLGKAKADADLIRAAVGSSPYVDAGILTAFMAAIFTHASRTVASTNTLFSRHTRCFRTI